MCWVDDKLMIKPLLNCIPKKVILVKNFSAAIFATAIPPPNSEPRECLSSFDLTESYLHTFLHWLSASSPIQHKQNVRCLRIWSQMSRLVSYFKLTKKSEFWGPFQESLAVLQNPFFSRKLELQREDMANSLLLKRCEQAIRGDCGPLIRSAAVSTHGINFNLEWHCIKNSLGGFCCWFRCFFFLS